MSYAHILPQERVLIEEYKIAGKSLCYIARQLKRSKSTINYELDRVRPYNALKHNLIMRISVKTAVVSVW